MIISNEKERTRFLKFMVVGTIGAVVDFGSFNILATLMGVSSVISSMISFVLALTSNFLWNRYWTYPDARSKHVSKQLGQFLVISFLGLAIRTPLFALLEKWMIRLFTDSLPTLSFSPTFLGHNFALATVIIIIMFWNFFANRFWTYNDVD
jgi:putative flippase GtrA